MKLNPFSWQSNPTRRGELVVGPAMILPAVAGLCIFQFAPLGVAIVNSFRAFNPFTHRAGGFVGWANFTAVLADPPFLQAVLVTLAYIVLMLVVVVPLALALALLLDRRMPGTAIARGAILGALAASEAVSALIWNQMYQPDSGLFNAVLKALSLPAQPFLNVGWQAILSIVVMSAWKDVGLPMLIFLGGLQAISPTLYEASSIDGATPWRQFTRITLPLMRPSIVLAMFMVTLSGARLFTPVVILTQGGPGGQTSNLTFYSYAQSFLFNSPGRASASVMFMLALLVVITLVQAFALRSRQGETA